jgi:hypothetical protein
MTALKLGFQISLNEIRADEFYAILIVADERERLEQNRLSDAQR